MLNFYGHFLYCFYEFISKPVIRIGIKPYEPVVSDKINVLIKTLYENNNNFDCTTFILFARALALSLVSHSFKTRTEKIILKFYN